MKRLFAAGAHVKFTGDCGLVAPPLVSTRKEIDEIRDLLHKVLGDL